MTEYERNRLAEILERLEYLVRGCVQSCYPLDYQQLDDLRILQQLISEFKGFQE